MSTLVLLSLLVTSGAESAASHESAVVASYRDGSVTAAALDDWRRYLQLEGRKATLRQAVEDLVVVRVLAAAAEDGGSVPANEALGSEAREVLRLDALRLDALRLDAKWLDKQLRREAQPGEKEIRAAYEAAGVASRKPKRWRLSNLFLRVDEGAEPAERKSTRKRIEALRLRVASGEAFASLAAAESDSQTRLRGGDMGFVSLDRLRPAVASHVRTMGEGDLSPVIEVPEGFLLLTCTDVLEARLESYEDARPRFATRLYDRQLQALERALGTRLEAELSPRWPEDVQWTEPGATIVEYQLDGAKHRLTVGQLETFLEDPVLEIDAPARRAATLERLMLEARAAEARRRGCRDDPDHRLRLELGQLERRAQRGANRLAADAEQEPSAVAVEAWIEEHRERLFVPETRHLRAVVVPRHPSLGRDYFEHLRLLGEELAGKGGDLEQVSRELGPPAELVDYGWLGDSQVWQLGRNIDHAVKSLAPGQISELVQQGARLYLLEVLASKARRELTGSEARDTARAAILTASRRRAGRALRQEILAEQQITLERAP